MKFDWRTPLAPNSRGSNIASPFRIVVSFTAHEPSPPASSRLLLIFNDEEQNNVAQILQPVESQLSANDTRRY